MQATSSGSPAQEQHFFMSKFRKFFLDGWIFPKSMAPTHVEDGEIGCKNMIQLYDLSSKDLQDFFSKMKL